MICSKCGASNPQGNSDCCQCGAALSAATVRSQFLRQNGKLLGVAVALVLLVGGIGFVLGHNTGEPTSGEPPTGTNSQGAWRQPPTIAPPPIVRPHTTVALVPRSEQAPQVSYGTTPGTQQPMSQMGNAPRTAPVPFQTPPPSQSGQAASGLRFGADLGLQIVDWSWQRAPSTMPGLPGYDPSGNTYFLCATLANQSANVYEKTRVWLAFYDDQGNQIGNSLSREANSPVVPGDNIVVNLGPLPTHFAYFGIVGYEAWVPR